MGNCIILLSENTEKVFYSKYIFEIKNGQMSVDIVEIKKLFFVAKCQSGNSSSER